MVPILDQVDAERSTKGPAPCYTAHELERAVFFLRVSGKATYAEVRGLLAGDRSQLPRGPWLRCHAPARGPQPPRRLQASAGERRCPEVGHRVTVWTGHYR
jgi:hypothetical protein